MAEIDDLPRSLALAKAGLVAPEGARARVRARLRQSLPDVEAASSATAVLPRGLRAVTGARAWTVGLMGLSFVAGYWLRGARDDALPAALLQPRELSVQVARDSGERLDVARAQQPALPAVNASPLGAPTEPPLAEQRRVARRATPDRSAAGKGPAERKPLPEADSLAREVALLQRVERAIRAQEGQLALSLLSEHERDYPASSFREERVAARVLAACVAQQGSEASESARAEARRYLSGRAGSVYADRIRTLCALERESSSQESTRTGH